MSRARDKKQATRSRSEVLMESYRDVRKRVNKMNGELKRKYFTHKIASCEGEPKNMANYKKCSKQEVENYKHCFVNC